MARHSKATIPPLDYAEADPEDYTREEHLEIAERFEREAAGFPGGDERAGRFYYGAAAALRYFEFRYEGEGVSPEVPRLIANLERAVELHFFMAIGWLATIYRDGQEIVEPDEEKAKRLRSLERSEIRRIGKHYWEKITEFLEGRGFEKYRSKHMFKATDYGYCYVENDFKRLGLHLRQQLAVGKIKPRKPGGRSLFADEIEAEWHCDYHKTLQPPVGVSDEEHLGYAHAIQAVDLWCEREERLAAILRALDHCIDGWFRHGRWEI